LLIGCESDKRGIERQEFFTENDIRFIDSIGFDHIRILQLKKI